VIVSLPPWPNSWIKSVLATVGLPPTIATAPLLIKMFPAALRLALMVLPRPSPNTDSTRAPDKKLAEIDIVIVLSKVGIDCGALPSWTDSRNPHDIL